MHKARARANGVNQKWPGKIELLFYAEAPKVADGDVR